MGTLVTVAIPVLNAGSALERTLEAVNRQRVDGQIELLVCDSGSSDGSVALARRHGAAVIEIAPADFSHGRTRNLLIERATGEYVAFLTQDAVPAGDSWLAQLLGGFSLATDVGLSFGPYRPRPDASPSVARELTEWFQALSVDGAPRIDRLDTAERGAPATVLHGARGYFTDANGCVARAAWRQVPFRDTHYAEDHRLAQDMLRAGLAKVYVPGAAVIHSHDYSVWGWLRRSFDEGRAMHEVYGWREPIDLRTAGLNVWGRVGADRRWARARAERGLGAPATVRLLAASTVHHLARTAGAGLGARAERLPPALAGHLSLERHPG